MEYLLMFWNFIVYTVDPDGLSNYLFPFSFHQGFLSICAGMGVTLFFLFFWIAAAIFAGISLYSFARTLWETFGPYEYYESKSTTAVAKVVAINYEASHTTHGYGVASNGAGVMTTSYTPEEYNVIVRSKDLGQWIFEDSDLFANVEHDDEVTLHYYHNMRRRKDYTDQPRILGTEIFKIVAHNKSFEDFTVL